MRTRQRNTRIWRLPLGQRHFAMSKVRTNPSTRLLRAAACLSLLMMGGCAAKAQGNATVRASAPQQQAYASVYTNPGAASLQTSAAVVRDADAPPPSYATQAAQFEH